MTYPLYLLHAHLGYMLLSRFASDQTRMIPMVLVVAGILIGAWAIHAIVERRLASRWKALFESMLGRPLDTLIASLHRQAGGADRQGTAAALGACGLIRLAGDEHK